MFRLIGVRPTTEHRVIFDGREFELTVASDVKRDGLSMELNELVAGERRTVAEVFATDADATFATTEYESGVPRAALAWLEEQARRRLRSRSDAV